MTRGEAVNPSFDIRRCVGADPRTRKATEGPFHRTGRRLERRGPDLATDRGIRALGSRFDRVAPRAAFIHLKEYIMSIKTHLKAGFDLEDYAGTYPPAPPQTP